MICKIHGDFTGFYLVHSVKTETVVKAIEDNNLVGIKNGTATQIFKIVPKAFPIRKYPNIVPEVFH